MTTEQGIEDQEYLQNIFPSELRKSILSHDDEEAINYYIDLFLNGEDLEC